MLQVQVSQCRPKTVAIAILCHVSPEGRIVGPHSILITPELPNGTVRAARLVGVKAEYY